MGKCVSVCEYRLMRPCVSAVDRDRETFEPRRGQGTPTSVLSLYVETEDGYPRLSSHFRGRALGLIPSEAQWHIEPSSRLILERVRLVTGEKTRIRRLVYDRKFELLPVTSTTVGHTVFVVERGLVSFGEYAVTEGPSSVPPGHGPGERVEGHDDATGQTVLDCRPTGKTPTSVLPCISRKDRICLTRKSHGDPSFGRDGLNVG